MANQPQGLRRAGVERLESSFIRGFKTPELSGWIHSTPHDLRHPGRAESSPGGNGSGGWVFVLHSLPLLEDLEMIRAFSAAATLALALVAATPTVTAAEESASDK